MARSDKARGLSLRHGPFRRLRGQELRDGQVAGAARGPDLAPRAVLRILVRPEAQEPRPVPEAIALELVVAHLDHELWPDGVPIQLAAGRPAALSARDPLVAQLPLRDHLRELLLELASHRGGEARAVADEVELALVAVEPEQHRRDPPIALVAPAEADDHAVGGLVRLHLDDAVARAREVRQVRPLGDHAVEARLRQVFQPTPALLRVTRDRRERELLRLPLQLAPPPLQRQLVHGLALPDEQVERDVLRGDLRRELPDPALGRVQPE